MSIAGTSAITELWAKVKALVGTKQDALVSGTNIKTVNNQSLLGSGNISIEGGGGGDVYYLRQDYLWLKLGTAYTTTTSNQTLTNWSVRGSVGNLITYSSGTVHLASGYCYMVSGTVSCQGASNGSKNTACELIADGYDFSNESIAGVLMTSPLTSASFATGSFGLVMLNATNSSIDLELVARSTNGGSLIRAEETTLSVICLGPVSADVLPAAGVSF